jgi:hypothetical protein
MSNQKQPKDELGRLIRESKPKSEEIAKWAGEVLQGAQYLYDLADTSEKVVQYLAPSNIDWEATIGAWQNINEQQDSILANLRRTPIQPMMTSGSSALAYEMTPFANPQNLIRNVAIGQQDEARVAAIQLGYVIDRFTDKEKVLSLLRQFGLDRVTPDEKSPVEHFETAWAAFEKPVTQSSPVITSLIPMRQCIGGAIEALLRRRPTREPAKNWYDKVMSLGRQLAKEGVSTTEIQSLALRWGQPGGDGLVDELSGSKKWHYSREEWQESLRQATLLLLELLQSMDSAKLK